MIDEHHRRRPTTLGRHDLATLAGGVALLVSPFLQWVRRGPGNTLSGREMIDAIVALGDALPGLSAARLAVAWYLVPASGAVLFIAVGLGRGKRAAAGLALGVTALVFVGFVRLAGVADLGPGPWLAAAGALLAAATTLQSMVRR